MRHCASTNSSVDNKVSFCKQRGNMQNWGWAQLFRRTTLIATNTNILNSSTHVYQSSIAKPNAFHVTPQGWTNCVGTPDNSDSIVQQNTGTSVITI